MDNRTGISSSETFSPPILIWLIEESAFANGSYSKYCFRREGVVNVNASGFSFSINLVSDSMFLASSSLANTNVFPYVKLMKSAINATNETVITPIFFFILEYA